MVIRGIMKFFGAGGSSDTKEESSSRGTKELEHFVDYVVKALVDHPDEVNIKLEKENDLNIIKILCNKEDIGKIVGKRGKTIMAIRSLVSGAAGRLQQKVSVEVMD